MSQVSVPVRQTLLVVDDHETILENTLLALKEKFPLAKILTAQNRQAAQSQFERYRPELIVLDLSLPEKPYSIATSKSGIQLLKTLMQASPAPNIVVLSTNIKPLVSLKPLINTYEGGFAAMDKFLPMQEILKFVDFALRGSIYLPPLVRSRPEFDRKWIEVLKLKFQQGLTDKAIAEQMAVSDRTIRNYWFRIQDALGISEEPDKEIKIQIEIAARKIGLIG